MKRALALWVLFSVIISHVRDVQFSVSAWGALDGTAVVLNGVHARPEENCIHLVTGIEAARDLCGWEVPARTIS